MEKMTQLANYLASQNLFSSRQLSSWVEEVNLKVGAKDEGERVLLHRSHYRAVLLVENYNYSANSIDTFTAHVAIWLAENDERTDLNNPHPSIAVDVLSSRYADLELSLEFEEAVYISRATRGGLTYNGQSWRLEKADHLEAESASVDVNLALENDE
ncbi:phage tail protein [Marinomonas aquiplantarum]|uniref:Tail completion protein R (GpR) n=1 Tax=Marinomonas aquiplantarum TaxID=491951 RepID=A0A366D7A0_9GAMM|nr:phage tail protein [Marinomonas aquiplantarum]RBO85917.1 tail completion protein R (GpR) [Marinomonas aquiplantarum]